MERKKKKMSRRRRAFLIAVGYLSLALDRLEGKPTAPPESLKRGRIRIVS